MEEDTTSRVVIGMDPHKRSVTIEVMGSDEAILGGGRFDTDPAGYQDMLEVARAFPQRVWAIEGCNGIGRHVAVRLLAVGEQVIDVPPKLSARVRTFTTGQGRKTDATDAHSIALVGPGWLGCARSLTMSSSPCCGCWSTGAGPWGRTTPGSSRSCITFCWS